MKLRFKKLNNRGVSHHFVLAVLAVSVIGGFGAYRVFFSKAATLTIPIKIVQANIKYDLPDADYRQDLIKVMDTDPDFITLNEASDKKASEIELRGYNSVGSTTLAADGPDYRYKQDTRPLWKIERWQYVTSGRKQLSSSDVEGGNRWANWVTVCKRPDINKVCVSTSKRVTLISVHTLQNPMISDTRKALFVTSMKNLRDLINARSAAGAVIVGGDFNLEYSTYIASTNPDFPKILLRDKANSISTYIYLGKPADWKTNRKGGDGSTIDYVFYRRNQGLVPVSQRLIYADKSDHNFVLANFTLQK